MTSKLATFGALLTCAVLSRHAIANDGTSPTIVAQSFVAALQHDRFKDASAMFAPEATQNTASIAASLKQIGKRAGGFSTMHRVASLPNGTSVKFEVRPGKILPLTVRKSVQFTYTSNAIDGKPVFYVLDLTADKTPPRLMSFALHLPVSGASSSQPAAQVASGINR